MNIYTQFTNPLFPTAQTSPIFGEVQVKNNAGGYVYEVKPTERLLRFLILGSEGGTYYVSEQKLTEDNAKSILALIKTNGLEVVNTTVQVSTSGRAPKNDPAIFVLALAATHGNNETKKAVYDSIHKVCRIGTHLFHFAEMVNNMRKWSGGLRRGMSNFYLQKDAGQLASQLLKYRQRGGWTHRDVLRLCHAGSTNSEINNLLRYAVGKEVTEKHALVVDFEKLQALKENEIKSAVKIIEGNKSVTWEMLPTQLLKSIEIWKALLPSMPITATLRNMAKMAGLGMFKSILCDDTKLVVSKLNNKEALKHQKVHPFQMLLAMKMYAQGCSQRNENRWTPAPGIITAMNDAFYECFQNVEPTNKNVLIGMDISGSMGSQILNSPITCAEAAGAMAMLALRTEPYCEVMGFSNSFIKLGLTKSDTLDKVMKKIQGLMFGSTDCSLPMIYAQKNKLPVDLFQVITDNETYAGQIHPSQALRQYRKEMNRQSKLVVMGMAATNFTIADPTDPGMLDVVGFDASVPVLISNFAKGFTC